MGWKLRKMALTLEDPATGEAQEFEVTPSGKDCEEKSKSKPAKAESKPAKAESKPASPDARKAGQYAPHKSEAAANDGGKKKSVPRKPPRRKASSLDWSPCVDHDYKGFKARSGAGQFKLLRAKNTQWALFYELAGSKARKVGCYGKEMEGKVKAQALHDEGWPASETSGGVTAEDLKGACPMPSKKDEAKPETKKQESKMERGDQAPKNKSETSPTTTTPAAPPEASKSDAQKDQELLASFSSELNSMLDEDGEDD